MELPSVGPQDLGTQRITTTVMELLPVGPQDQETQLIITTVMELLPVGLQDQETQLIITTVMELSEDQPISGNFHVGNGKSYCVISDIILFQGNYIKSNL